jgi:hypothetical protein
VRFQDLPYIHETGRTRHACAGSVIKHGPDCATNVVVAARRERYTLTSGAGDYQSKIVQLNGQPLALGAGDTLSALSGVPVPAGTNDVPARLYHFSGVV